jgi:hypothetical protein
VRPILGTIGATAPRISPDGARVAFLIREQVMVVPIAGGEARRLLQAQATMSLQWISATELLVVDLDGNRLTWLDPEGGNPRTKNIVRCALGQWIPELRQLLCSYNRNGTLVDLETGTQSTIRSARPDGSPGSLLAGTAFRLVDKHYLVYLSVDGKLLAARFEPATQVVQRSVALIAGIRREAIGEAQYDIAASGTLVYAPGVDASVGRMVSLHPGGAPQPLPMELGDFQRYDLSRDRRWLAAVVQAADGTDLRIYDLRDGQQFTWLKGETIRHPLWSPDGERLVVAVRDSTRWTLLRGAPSSGARPDTIAGFGYAPNALDPIDLHDDHSAIAQDWGGSVVIHFDPGIAHPTFDTVITGARFASVSPNGRLIAYQSEDGGRIVVTAYPVAGHRWQLASDGVEPLWLSGTEVLYRSGVSWYLTRLNAETGEPVGAPTFWARDPRFSDTSGWSNRPSRDGGILYVQGPAETSARYLRVVPDWVKQMEAAIDAANR